DLVVVNDANGAYLPVSRLAEGSEVDLATLAGKLANVIAISEDASKTGSVEFSLDGPVSIQRTENNAAYALANESEHLDINGGELPAGDYTLIVTPYAEANAAGEAGIPLLLNFSVTGQVAPPVADPQAVNDSYSLTAGSGSQPGQSRAVSSNDVFESGAVFTITKAPINGTATMFDLGFFTYEPKAGFTGTDTFTYQISQGGKTASATASVSVVAPVTGTSAGFTAIKPSADSKLIYVSSSVGKDTNACLTEAAPCKTVSAGMEKMRAGYPDHLYLKRGDVWRDELLKEFVSGRSAAEPSVLGFYGTSGARPRLESAQNLLHAFTLKNANFIGVEFSNHTKVSGSASFTGTGKGDIVFLGPVSNVLIEDCVFNHIEFIAQKWTTGNPTNISLRRNIWTGAYYNETSYHRNSRPSNVYAEGVMGLLIEENVFDFGGWHPSVKGASANMFNHNLYLQAGSDGNKLVLRNNIISRGSSHGAQLRSGGLAEDNFFGRNAIGLLVGYEKTALPAGTRAHLKNNVVSEGHSMFKGTNPCAGGNGVLWNHLCTGAVFGINIDVHGAADYVSTGNIVSGRATGDDKWKQFTSGLQARSYVIQRITDADKSRTVVESGNIAWHWSNATEGDGNGYKNPGLTLADYNASLGGTKSYDEFMNKVKTRPLQSWDVKYTAKSVNQYIRAGFAK
ncbi:MAG TPA: Ig-like domain-containing protein, partial [Cellvibrio sp.]|nr:Ig-like domain-containing protein [Cellvibrio sp.]